MQAGAAEVQAGQGGPKLPWTPTSYSPTFGGPSKSAQHFPHIPHSAPMASRTRDSGSWASLPSFLRFQTFQVFCSLRPSLVFPRYLNPLSFPLSPLHPRVTQPGVSYQLTQFPNKGSPMSRSQNGKPIMPDPWAQTSVSGTKGMNPPLPAPNADARHAQRGLLNPYPDIQGCAASQAASPRPPHPTTNRAINLHAQLVLPSPHPTSTYKAQKLGDKRKDPRPA